MVFIDTEHAVSKFYVYVQVSSMFPKINMIFNIVNLFKNVSLKVFVYLLVAFRLLDTLAHQYVFILVRIPT